MAHEADVELAQQCAAGDEAAWERFVHDYRPVLYRAAHTLDATGGAREVADSLFAELYGVRTGDRDRRSLFLYFQGRSSLATWLRAVLAQRYVDRTRAARRLEALPAEDDAFQVGERQPRGAITDPPDVDRPRYLSLIRQALQQAVARLTQRDRLRLGFYYVQNLTLAETGRLLAEHEATVSRQLARTRRAIRRDVERHLSSGGLSEPQIAECFACVAGDPGPIDVTHLFEERKEPAAGRS
jgi:RNA polymerase sigma factor (sigma-70 family)